MLGDVRRCPIDDVDWVDGVLVRVGAPRRVCRLGGGGGALLVDVWDGASGML